MSQVNTAVVGPVATHSRRRRGMMFRYPRPHRCRDTPGPSPATPTAVAPLRTLLSSRARARVAAGSNILTTAHPTLVQRRARGRLTGRLSDAFLYSCRLTNEMRMTDNISLFFFYLIYLLFSCCVLIPVVSLSTESFCIIILPTLLADNLTFYTYVVVAFITPFTSRSLLLKRSLFTYFILRIPGVAWFIRSVISLFFLLLSTIPRC